MKEFSNGKCAECRDPIMSAIPLYSSGTFYGEPRTDEEAAALKRIDKYTLASTREKEVVERNLLFTKHQLEKYRERVQRLSTVDGDALAERINDDLNALVRERDRRRAEHKKLVSAILKGDGAVVIPPDYDYARTRDLKFVMAEDLSFFMRKEGVDAVLERYGRFLDANPNRLMSIAILPPISINTEIGLKLVNTVLARMTYEQKCRYMKGVLFRSLEAYLTPFEDLRSDPAFISSIDDFCALRKLAKLAIGEPARLAAYVKYVAQCESAWARNVPEELKYHPEILQAAKRKACGCLLSSTRHGRKCLNSAQ